MICHRVVFQAKMGMGDEFVARLKAALENVAEEQRSAMQPRILTDISGPFFTVVLETHHASLAAYEQVRAAMFAEDSGGDAEMFGLIESGRNEYYTLEYTG